MLDVIIHYSKIYIHDTTNTCFKISKVLFS